MLYNVAVILVVDSFENQDTLENFSLAEGIIYCGTYYLCIGRLNGLTNHAGSRNHDS